MQPSINDNLIIFGPHHYSVTSTVNIRKEIIDATVSQVQILDNMHGFSSDYRNVILDQIADLTLTIWTQYILPEQVKAVYPNLTFKFDMLTSATSHCVLTTAFPVKDVLDTKKDFKEFISSFNGMDRDDRRVIVAALIKRGWFNATTCTKNLNIYTPQLISTMEEHQFFEFDKILDPDERMYSNTISSMYYDRDGNIGNFVQHSEHLTPKINQSFIHLVSETFSMSYCPFLTEKVIRPIVSKSLWLASAQPHYHKYLEKYYGFKMYTRLFDYTFDSIENPIQRLLCLLDSIRKYSKLTPSDWHNLYSVERDTIEYNYDWYYSQNFLKHASMYADKLGE